MSVYMHVGQCGINHFLCCCLIDRVLCQHRAGNQLGKAFWTQVSQAADCDSAYESSFFDTTYVPSMNTGRRFTYL